MYALNFFFPLELSLNIVRELSFEWAQPVQNFISRLKMGMISFKQSLYKAHYSVQLKYKHKYSMVHTSDTT